MNYLECGVCPHVEQLKGFGFVVAFLLPTGKVSLIMGISVLFKVMDTLRCV